MNVTKRDGSTESYDVEKIHKVVEWAIDGITNVSLSDIEMNMNLQIVDGVLTSEVHQILIKSAYGLISESHPNYQYVAARLLSMSLRKEVWGHATTPPNLLHHIQINTDNGIYDESILGKWDNDSIKKFGSYIHHKRDDLYTYAGLQQMIDKYLVRNRSSNDIYETPQFAYMMIAMCLFDNVKDVKQAYDSYSTFKVNLPTPIMAGVRTVIRQFASCVLVDIGDSLDSIFSSVEAVGKYTARRGGIGLNAGRIRPLNSPVRGGEVVHTGLLPYLKLFESTVKSTSQNGIRGGGGTVYVPFWHYEIEDVLVLKNNAGTDDTRIRKLDYAPQFCRLFYQRFLDDQDITLFSPHEAAGLYEAFGDNDAFEEIYLKHEHARKLRFKKKISARKLMETYVRERLETGRIYCMNIDNVNEHGSWNIPITMSNLCCLPGETNVWGQVNEQPAQEYDLEKLVSEWQSGAEVAVKSYNTETRLDSYEKVQYADLTRENAELMEIVDSESGFRIECTPDHRLLTKSRGYVMAEDLLSDDVLVFS